MSALPSSRATCQYYTLFSKNDEVVYESDICDEYLDQKYPDNKLLPDDPYQRARAKILMGGFDNVNYNAHTHVSMSVFGFPTVSRK